MIILRVPALKVWESLALKVEDNPFLKTVIVNGVVHLNMICRTFTSNVL